MLPPSPHIKNDDVATNIWKPRRLIHNRLVQHFTVYKALYTDFSFILLAVFWETCYYHPAFAVEEAKTGVASEESETFAPSLLLYWTMTMLLPVHQLCLPYNAQEDV